MLIALLVLQIITLIFGIMPVFAFLTCAFYDWRKEQKEKAARIAEAHRAGEELKGTNNIGND